MARERLESNEKASEFSGTDITEIIDSYIANKGEADRYGKLAKSENEEIKRRMNDDGIDYCEGTSGAVKISVQTKETFREEELIAFLKEVGASRGIVKKKEYIDFDALESAIYHSKISEDTVREMDRFKDKQEIVKLLISKKKEA